MRFVGILIVFSITSIARDAKGTFTLDSIKEFIAPRQPDVNRVRRIENADGDPLAVLDTVGLVERHGYPAEEHNITTEDGYNIVFFRIPGSPSSPPKIGKPIVFIQHGLFGSSDFFVLMGPKNDLAFLLADAGYDVWLGNMRGNTYGRSHKNMTIADKEFWNHSFDEIGMFDVPSMIDYALDYTGEKKLFYIGHSLGTTVTYVFLSEKPEYNEKMRLIVCLAPAPFWKYELNSFYRFLRLNWDLVHNVTGSLGIYGLFPQTKNNARLFQIACSDRSSLRPLCVEIARLMFGEPASGFDTSFLSFASMYIPAGAAEKILHHYSQSYKKSGLPKYDNGPDENLKIYGTRKPPTYDISKISAPIALFYGKTDPLSIPQNVIRLSKLLRNLVTCEAVPIPVFNHLDFVWSRHAKDLLYPRIIELLSKSLSNT